MNDLMCCIICGEYFNRAFLSEVFEHEHKGIEIKKEYIGSKKGNIKRRR